MFGITGTTITITRGDTAEITFEIKNADGTAFEPSEGDEVVFTVKESTVSETVLIQKTGTSINILSSDTSALPYGVYVYDVQVTLATGQKNTVIEPSPFIITEEVNWS